MAGFPLVMQEAPAHPADIGWQVVRSRKAAVNLGR